MGFDEMDVSTIWMNGEYKDWEDATVHVLTHGLHYGTGVFEGVRAYDTDRGPAIFRWEEHLERLPPLAEKQWRKRRHPVDAFCCSLIEPC